MRKLLLVMTLFAALCGAQASPVLKDKPVNPQSVRKIYLIFKTHLDVGFTNSPDTVINTYLHDFIPRTLDLTAKLRDSDHRYVWTTGSWLIYEFLRTASPEQRAKMEDAIRHGDIVWHALPFTTHTELEDAALFNSGLQIARQLDRRFGKRTISAKITDVPGQTRSIVPLLSKAGIKLLHIGVNAASTSPDVPSLFRWEAPDGSSIAVMYQQGYGDQLVLPGTGIMVDIRFTNDNHGPHTIEQIEKIYSDLHSKFPNAQIVAGSLDDVAQEVEKIKDRLPVVKHELGDTWIHGTGSDPLMVADFRELMRLHRQWLADGKLVAGSQQDLDFSIPLLLVAEHTWGRDVKTYLADWGIYKLADFQKARQKPNFQLMEQSWQEKRNWLNHALDALSPSLREEAEAHIDMLRPVDTDLKGYKPIKNNDKVIRTKYFELKINPEDGSLLSLIDRTTHKEWASEGHPLFSYTYQHFSNADFQHFQDQYLVAKWWWAIADFGKPGLDKIQAESRTWKPHFTVLRKHTKEGLSLLFNYTFDASAEGAPGKTVLELQFPDSAKVIGATLKWFNKPATRMPEATWLTFKPITNGGFWEADKMGSWVAARDVESRGNRKMHACDSGVRLRTPQGTLMVESLDAPLAMFGGGSLLDFNNQLPDADQGVSFGLHNNVWGTNFSMWFGEDMQYRFLLRFE